MQNHELKPPMRRRAGQRACLRLGVIKGKPHYFCRHGGGICLIVNEKNH